MIAIPEAGGLRSMRNALAALLASALVLALAGCSDAPGEPAAQGPPPNPLLYEIASVDGTVEGWLFGTIHALPDGTDWRTPTLSRTVKRADLLVVEIATLDDRKALAKTFAALGTKPGQPALDRRLPPDLQAPLVDLLERGNMDADAFAATESWAAALMLAQIDAVGDPANGVDRALIREFPATSIRELEGASPQLTIFDTLPEAEQRRLLAAVVREAGTAETRGAELREAWLTGNEAKLEAANTTGFLTNPALREALLVARNRRWNRAIAAILNEAPRPLVAVGTAHLVGPDGLAAMLRARGYRVRRLP